MKLITSKKYIISKGFTLVELMVTIILVSILSAIALPTLMQPVSRAKATEAITKISGLLTSSHADFQLDEDTDNVIQALGDPTTGQLKNASSGGNFLYTVEKTAVDVLTITATGKSEVEGGDPRITGQLVFGCVDLTTGKVDISRQLLSAGSAADTSCN